MAKQQVIRLIKEDQMRLLLLLGFFILGCSSVHQVNIGPSTNVQNNQSHQLKKLTGLTLDEPEFLDNRANKETVNEFQQGVAKIKLFEGASFEETITSDVKRVLINQGIVFRRGYIGEGKLRIVFEEIYAAREAGGMITAISHIKIRLDVFKSGDALAVFSKTYRGSNQESYMMGTLKILDVSLQNSWDQCLQKVSGDQEIFSVLASMKSH